MLHTLGALLLIARLSHAYGISSLEAPGKFRVAGMAGPFTTITLYRVSCDRVFQLRARG